MPTSVSTNPAPLLAALFLAACTSDTDSRTADPVSTSSSTSAPTTPSGQWSTVTTVPAGPPTGETRPPPAVTSNTSDDPALPTEGSTTPASGSTTAGESLSSASPSSDLAIDDQTTRDSGSGSLATTDDEHSSQDVAHLPALQPPADPISFGTTLDAATVMTESRDLAARLANPNAPNWRAKGDQHRTYRFDGTNRDEPYRLYVPESWDGETKLRLVMFLHGSGSDENTYVDQNNQQMLTLARDHQTILVAPLGAAGAYGNFLRLSSPFGNPQAAAELMAQVTPDSRKTNELSEMDVINVLELVLAEYPVDHSAMYLTGHSMGSGGTWYIGGKYSTYWRAIAPMSGPFVQETGFPWNNLTNVGIFVTEGTDTPSLEGSRLLANWLEEQGFDAQYQEVDADHGGMVPRVLPAVFAFFAQ